MSITGLFDSFARDLRQTLRGLQRRPTFTLTVVLTLALGVGATTAIFSVVNAVVIKPLPYPESEAIVTVMYSSVTGNVRTNSFPFDQQMLDLHATSGQAFEELGMYRSGQSAMTGLGDAEQVNTLMVTAGALRVLNVQPALGRSISRDDDQPESAETVVLSDGFWRRRFGGDPSVIGRAITIDGRPREVIGVMPARFALRGLPMDLIMPMRLNMAPPSTSFCCIGLGRLKPGVAVAEANADVDRVLQVYLDKY